MVMCRRGASLAGSVERSGQAVPDHSAVPFDPVMFARTAYSVQQPLLLVSK